MGVPVPSRWVEGRSFMRFIRCSLTGILLATSLVGALSLRGSLFLLHQGYRLQLAYLAQFLGGVKQAWRGRVTGCNSPAGDGNHLV